MTLRPGDRGDDPLGARVDGRRRAAQEADKGEGSLPAGSVAAAPPAARARRRPPGATHQPGARHTSWVAGFAAVVLAGGQARRMGGALKPALPVGGEAMLRRVLAAVAAAQPRIVVGPLELVPLVPGGVSLTIEEPPGGGPVAAIAAGLALLTDAQTVAVVGGDLPFLDPATVDLLRSSLGSDTDGAVLVDDEGRPQWLCGVWRRAALDERLATLGNPSGRSVRELLGELRVTRVGSGLRGPPPWFDCDTVDDLRRAEELADGGTG